MTVAIDGGNIVYKCARRHKCSLYPFGHQFITTEEGSGAKQRLNVLTEEEQVRQHPGFTLALRISYYHKN